MRIDFHARIDEIDADAWNLLAGNDYPFLRHEFLRALESSGSTGAASGWQPLHLALRDGGRLLALMPCYLKSHSWGEYVFDWSWADAYRRHGLAYYPKLVTAVPFTPATGPRLLLAPGTDARSALDKMLDSLRQLCSAGKASSWHLLFAERPLAEDCRQRGLGMRAGVQYHWTNPGYRDFDDFLDTLVARKRKSLRRERRQVAEQGIVMKRLRGSEIDAETWDRFDHFYRLTYTRRSGHGGYLERDFFSRIGRDMPDRVLLVLAERDGQAIAGALNIIGADTLFGRYWGCTEYHAQLHFETCYYQGMEFCIEQGLRRFDAGAQGEHKLARGFAPHLTWSSHMIAHAGFDAAVKEFLQRERQAMNDYFDDAMRMLPYREAVDSADFQSQPPCTS